MQNWRSRRHDLDAQYQELRRLVAARQIPSQDAMQAWGQLWQRHLDDCAEMEELALTDPLTKLGNRRFFEDALQRCWAQARRYRIPLSMIMLDLDDFKQINDLAGHVMGDRVLARMAELLKRETRKSDFVCRFGGDEFVVLLPHTELSGGVILGERLLAEARKSSVPQGACSSERERDPAPTTLSAGVSAFLQTDASPDVLLQRADSALRAAKSTGKNQLVSLPGPIA